MPGTRLRTTCWPTGRSVAFLAEPGAHTGEWTLARDGTPLAAGGGGRAHAGDPGDDRRGAQARAEKQLKAPMPGLVVRVEVEVGDAVAAGQGVVIVEAMKMENELKAPADGAVAEVRVEPGQPVEKGAVLLVLE